MREFEDHIQWSTVKAVASTLKEAGYVALLAGGCVRDMIMNREPNDFDLASDATPDQVAALYPNALLVGRQFGVTILPYLGFQLEIATFRQDLEYKDGRRPEGVTFSNPEEDAKRRDFTVNALFYDLQTHQVIDYVGGQADIRARTLRTVGDPDKRFGEDQLRLLRAVRFAAQLEFELDPATLEAVNRLAARVQSVSRERVRDEIFKLLKSPSRLRGLKLLLSTGLMEALFPNVWSRLSSQQTIWLQRFEKTASQEEPQMSVTALLVLFFYPLTLAGSGGETDGDELRAELKNLRLETRQIEAIIFTSKRLENYLNPLAGRRGAMALLLAHGDSRVAESVADLVSKTDLLHDESAQEVRHAAIEQIAAGALGENRARPLPLVNGADLKAAGVAPGPNMGELLAEAYLQQLEGQLESKSQALRWVEAQLNKKS